MVGPGRHFPLEHYLAKVRFEDAIVFIDSKSDPKDPNFASVDLNRAIDTALGVKGVSKQRPDITVIYKDGRTVRICECVSKGQSLRDQELKNKQNVTKLHNAGYKGKSDVIERGGDNDPTLPKKIGEEPSNAP